MRQIVVLILIIKASKLSLRSALSTAPVSTGVVFFVLWATLNASAGIFEDSATHDAVVQLQQQQSSNQSTLTDLDSRVSRIESSLHDYPSIINKLDAINQELAELRGKTDEQSKRIDDLDKHQHDLYQDLDARLKILEGGSSVSAKAEEGAAIPPVETKADDSKAQTPSTGFVADYDAGLTAFSSGKYAEALKKFDSFYRANPDDPKAPNALYWMGMNQLLLKNYKAAKVTNQLLYRKFPESTKAPDALLNLSSAYVGLGEKNNVQSTLKLLIKKYPDSSAATKARSRLKYQ